MYIYVAYKDPSELSAFRRRSNEADVSDEKLLLVNPNCPVRIMLEYIRKQCKLAQATQFDLAEENGVLKGLFNYATFSYVTPIFEHRKTYYLIVIRPESEKLVSVFPQVNRDNKLYLELQMKVKRFLQTGDASPQSTPTAKGSSKRK